MNLLQSFNIISFTKKSIFVICFILWCIFLLSIGVGNREKPYFIDEENSKAERVLIFSNGDIVGPQILTYDEVDGKLFVSMQPPNFCKDGTVRLSNEVEFLEIIFDVKHTQIRNISQIEYEQKLNKLFQIQLNWSTLCP